MSKVTHIVFDLGGVVVQLRGTPIKKEWFPERDQSYLQNADIWSRWLTGTAPRLFESGKIGKQEFAERVVTELELSTSTREFADYFTLLPEKPYPGAKELLAELRPKYTTALFSNSNELHWQRLVFEWGLKDWFDHAFGSHIMGLVKPDAEAFEYVVTALNVPAEQIVFYDDNQLNVDAANQVGMQATRVVGVEALAKSLSELP